MRKVGTIAEKSYADFSKCEKYRYTLRREFANGNGKTINYIMLNPSTADEFFNDPTIGRCESYAVKKNFSTLIITNVFAYRATSPNDMKAQGKKAVGEDKKNDEAILSSISASDIVICAWGNHGSFLERSSEVKLLTKCSEKDNVHYLELNKSGEPKHPLYISGDVEPKKWLLVR